MYSSQTQERKEKKTRRNLLLQPTVTPRIPSKHCALLTGQARPQAAAKTNTAKQVQPLRSLTSLRITIRAKAPLKRIQTSEGFCEPETVLKLPA